MNNIVIPSVGVGVYHAVSPVGVPFPDIKGMMANGISEDDYLNFLQYVVPIGFNALATKFIRPQRLGSAPPTKVIGSLAGRIIAGTAMTAVAQILSGGINPVANVITGAPLLMIDQVFQYMKLSMDAAVVYQLIATVV